MSRAKLRALEEAERVARLQLEATLRLVLQKLEAGERVATNPDGEITELRRDMKNWKAAAARLPDSFLQTVLGKSSAAYCVVKRHKMFAAMAKGRP